MLRDGFTYQEISDIIDRFPNAAGKPEIYQESYDQKAIPVCDFIVGEKGERLVNHNTLFELCQEGFLNVRFRLVCIKSYGWMKQQWESLLRQKRTYVPGWKNGKLEYEQEKTEVYYDEKKRVVLDSENFVAPEGMTLPEKESLKDKARREYRDSLLKEKAVAKNFVVTLDTEPTLPDAWEKKRQEQLFYFQWQTFDKQNCVGLIVPGDSTSKVAEMLRGTGTNDVCEYEEVSLEWEIQKTSQCQALLKNFRLECCGADNGVLLPQAVSPPKTETQPADTIPKRLKPPCKRKKGKYPPLESALGRLPKARPVATEIPSIWISVETAATIGKVKAETLGQYRKENGGKTEIYHGDPQNAGDDAPEYRRDMYGRITYRHNTKSPVYYWKKLCGKQEIRDKFWDDMNDSLDKEGIDE